MYIYIYIYIHVCVCIDNLLITLHAFTRLIMTSHSVDEMLLPKYMNWSTNFRSLPQILGITHQKKKTAVVRPPASHLWNYSRETKKTCGALLEKQGRSKATFFYGLLHMTSQCWLTCKTCLCQLCTDTGCCLEDLEEVVGDWDGWRERVREHCAVSVTWCLWWYIVISKFWYFNKFLSDWPILKYIFPELYCSDL